MTYELLDARREGSIEYLTLNRPDVRNAFNDALIAELCTWAARAANDASLRAVVLAGAGKTFCAGADVAWMSRTLTYTEQENIRDAEAMSAMFNALDTLPCPLIGRIHGAALGGGSGLAAVCDIVIAADTATFGFTEVKLGILPAVISPFVVAKIGVSATRSLFLTGERFSAHRALQIGLVHVVVPESDLDRAVDGIVDEVLTAAPRATAAAKRLIKQVAYRPPAEVSGLTSRTIAMQRVSPEGQDGLRAFLEKRKAGWVS